jgi:hypothetical protein
MAVNIMFHYFLIIVVRILCFANYHFMFMSIFLSAIQILSLVNKEAFVVGHCRKSRMSRVQCGVVC